MQSQRNFHGHLEQEKEDLNRELMEVDRERRHLDNICRELKQRTQNAERQLDFEIAKFRELEQVISRERMQF